MLISDDPELGVGFLLNECDESLRDADNNCQLSVSSCSSCGSEIHDCGMLLSGAVWSVRNQLVSTEPSTYMDVLSNLTVSSILLRESGDGSITSSIPLE